MFCPKCGHETGEGHGFCTNCGFDLTSSAESPQVAGQGESAPRTGPSKRTTKIAVAVICACAAAAVVAIVVGAQLLKAPSGGPSGSVSDATDTAAVAVDASGKRVQALARPTFLNLSFIGPNATLSSTPSEVGPSDQAPADGGQAAAGREGEKPQGQSGAGAAESSGNPVVPQEGSTSQAGGENPNGGNEGSNEGGGEQGKAPVPSVKSYEIATDLSNVENVSRMYLDEDTERMLADKGFAVLAGSGGYEFYENYEENRYEQIPNFVTTDSMMHTYHLYFSHLLKNTEKKHLSAQLADVSVDMLKTSAEYYAALKGTEWESAASRNVAFFSVACELLGADGAADIALDSEVKSRAAADIERINAASSVEQSAVLGTEEDFTQYEPRGYYAGDDQLERYFRAMMWYGRVNFAQNEEDLDRSALLMTLALHQSAFEDWASIYTVTSFFAGASDDNGYYEYYPLIEAAYGAGATVESLVGNEAGWNEFHELTASMNPPKVNSVPQLQDTTDVDVLEKEKGFRFMGQRFTIDAGIFQQLVYDKVKQNESGQQRLLPNALDVPAALGSDTALQVLEAEGETSYSGYTENMQKLRAGFSSAPSSLVAGSLYNQWLYTLTPLLEEKGEGYPTFMQSQDWSKKNLQSYLCSYTELKHDTVLLAKQIAVEAGGAAMEELDDRGYVEPEPELYRRLSSLTQATSAGLEACEMLDGDDKDNLAKLSELADRLATIADKELQEQALADDEYELIRSYGVQLEHFWSDTYKDQAESDYFTGRDFPAALVTDIATNHDDQEVLEVATGNLSRIYVVVPVDGKLRIASGVVSSFYQFTQPLAQGRLTDSEWRQSMGIEQGAGGYATKPAQAQPSWTDSFTIVRSYE